MDPIIIYLIKVNLALGMLYLFYKAAFTNDTFFGLRRAMLLLMCAAAVTYPLLDLGAWMNDTNPFSLHEFYPNNIRIPEITILQTPEPGTPGFRIGGVLLLTAYFAGVILLFTRTLLELINTGKLFRATQKDTTCCCSFQVVSGKLPPFSFLKWIFINPDLHTPEELHEILIHEQTHIREKHFIDLILIQLIIILNWFNPFVWLIRKEIRLNHEYLADRNVIFSGIDRKTYQYHLLGIEHSRPVLANLSVNFNVLPLKRRIKMLNKKRTRNIMKSKYLMFIPLFGILLLSQQQVNSKPCETKPVATLQKPVEPDDPVFETVEVMPEFPGGMESLMKYLGSHIKYPVAAVNKNLSGRVIVQFVVNKDGSPVEAEVVHSTSEIFNDAALNVIKGMPKWTPGEQKGKKVRVKYTIPVSFQTKQPKATGNAPVSAK